MWTAYPDRASVPNRVALMCDQERMRLDEGSRAAALASGSPSRRTRRNRRSAAAEEEEEDDDFVMDAKKTNKRPAAGRRSGAAAFFLTPEQRRALLLQEEAEQRLRAEAEARDALLRDRERTLQDTVDLNRGRDVHSFFKSTQARLQQQQQQKGRDNGETKRPPQAAVLGPMLPPVHVTQHAQHDQQAPAVVLDRVASSLGASVSVGPRHPAGELSHLLGPPALPLSTSWPPLGLPLPGSAPLNLLGLNESRRLSALLQALCGERGGARCSSGCPASCRAAGAGGTCGSFACAPETRWTSSRSCVGPSGPPQIR